MQLDWLRPLTDLEGPFATAILDASTVDPANRDHPLRAWATSRRELEQAGAAQDTLAALDGAVTAPPRRAGEHTRALCACDGRLLLDLSLPGRPRRDSASFGPVPRLMDVVRVLDGTESQAVVRLDREGADIEVLDPTGETRMSTEVAGDHDELRKVGPGGPSQHRFQARAEDSWKHNAVQVAEELDRLVRTVDPAVVFVEGDDHMVSHLIDHASGSVGGRLVRLDTGGRARGTSDGAESTARDAVLARRRFERDTALLEGLGDAVGAGTAVEGWAAVSKAVRKAQVDHVLLQVDDDRGEGDELLWQLAATGGELFLLAQPLSAKDGVAAVLRWNDTPTDR